MKTKISFYTIERLGAPIKKGIKIKFYKYMKIASKRFIKGAFTFLTRTFTPSNLFLSRIKI